MATFTPFMQGSKAQSIIDGYLNDGGYSQAQTITDLNSAGNFRNPIFDLRTEQENAGTLTPEDLYPNPQLDFSAPDTPVDPCPEGFMLVDGICQPIETFGQSMYDKNRNDNNNVEERPYMSIDAMTNASDEELLDYLTSGFLKNSALGYLPSKGTEVTLGMGMLPPLLQLGFGGQNELRKDFILSELMKRGYFTGNFDDNKNPIFDIATKNVNTNVGGIESMLPANNMNEPVTDVFGDTYQQVYNSGTGDTGYSFTSGSDNNYTTGGENTGTIFNPSGAGGTYYGTGRGGTSSNQMTGGGNVFIGGNAFNPNTNPEDDYNDDSSGI